MFTGGLWAQGQGEPGIWDIKEECKKRGAKIGGRGGAWKSLVLTLKFLQDVSQCGPWTVCIRLSWGAC